MNPSFGTLKAEIHLTIMERVLGEGEALVSSEIVDGFATIVSTKTDKDGRSVKVPSIPSVPDSPRSREKLP
jgi:hypothetical protein